MRFYQQLNQKTESSREYLLSAPIINRCLKGNINLEEYVAFLTEAFHHVKHTVPLLMAMGSRLTMEQEWLRQAVAEYIEEELGHQEWILNDIGACGFDKEVARNSMPDMSTELMVSYAYDTINRVNPLAFFGMVLVLEGTSINLACRAADSIQEKLKLPTKAFTYLRSHGALDLEHMDFFEKLMNQINNPKDQADIIHAANVFYHLYGKLFRSLERIEQRVA